MGTVSAVDAALLALTNAVDGLGALDGVQVTDAWLGDEEAADEYVIFHDARASQEWQYVGRSTRDEEITIVGGVWVMKPGAGRAKAREARARAFVLWGAVEDYLRTAAGVKLEGTVLFVTRWAITNMDQGILPQGRYCMLETEINARARLQ